MMSIRGISLSLVTKIGIGDEFINIVTNCFSKAWIDENNKRLIIVLVTKSIYGDNILIIVAKTIYGFVLKLCLY